MKTLETVILQRANSFSYLVLRALPMLYGNYATHSSVQNAHISAAILLSMYEVKLRVYVRNPRIHPVRIRYLTVYYNRR